MPYLVTEVSSRLHRTGCHTGHNILLRTEIDDNCRKHCDQRCCECNIDICGIFAEEVELHQRKCTTVKLLAMIMEMMKSFQDARKARTIDVIVIGLSSGNTT